MVVIDMLNVVKEKIELMDYLHDLHYLNSKILELPHDKIKELFKKLCAFFFF